MVNTNKHIHNNNNIIIMYVLNRHVHLSQECKVDLEIVAIKETCICCDLMRSVNLRKNHNSVEGRKRLETIFVKY